MAKQSNKEMDLVTAIDQEMSLAIGSETDSAKLSKQRGKALEYYFGEPYGNEDQDHSSVVTREVLDTIEWMKPELMKLFADGSETVRFEPQNAQDVPQAQQATDYINYLFHRKNAGFKILYNWITDGLLQKTGIVKVWWDDENTKVREEYAGVTEMELQMLLAPDEVELQEQEEVIDEASGEISYNVAIIRTGVQSGLKIAVIPPEEYIKSRKATCVEDAPFQAHRTRMTVSDLQGMGYKGADELSGEDVNWWTDEYRARFEYDDTGREEGHDDQHADPTMREVWVVEAYIRTDYNDDGIAELRKVVKCGSNVLENVEVDAAPFAVWSPIMISHKFDGLSVADLVMDLQRIQSQLFRNLLDNQYLTNNGRYTAVEGMVNLDDLLTSRPHGVVRQKMPGAVGRLDTPQLGQTAFQMLEYVDSLREKRTGVSERTQGLDPNALGPNTAATAVNQVMTASQQRIELIARVFGETGLTDLFRLMYKEVLQNQTSKDIFRLRDTYIEVDPSEWRERKDTSVVVGLGNGSKESEMMQLNQIVQLQQQFSSNPAMASLVAPGNVYQAAEDMVKVYNKAAAGRYFSDPTSPEAQQQAQQAQQQQQELQQKEEQIRQLQLQLQQKQVENDTIKVTADKDRKEAQTALDQEAQALNEQVHEDSTALKTAELDMEYELEKEQGRGVSIG